MHRAFCTNVLPRPLQFLFHKIFLVYPSPLIFSFHSMCQALIEKQRKSHSLSIKEKSRVLNMLLVFARIQYQHRADINNSMRGDWTGGEDATAWSPCKLRLSFMFSKAHDTMTGTVARTV